MGGCISSSPHQPQIDDDEYQCWLSKIEEAKPIGWSIAKVLRDAPYHIRNNKNIVMEAVKKNGTAFKFATPELQNDKEVVMAAVKLGNMWALQYTSPSLQNDKQVVMTATKYDRSGYALKFASPSLRNDKEVVMTAIQNYEGIFRFSPLRYVSPSLKNDKEVVIAAMNKDGEALEFASPQLQNDIEVVTEALKKHPNAIKFASPELRQDKNFIITVVKQHPDAIKFVHEDLKRDPDVLAAAGMFDVDHDDAPTRQQQSTNNITSRKKKVVLSTRFSLNQSSWSQATMFTAFFKSSEYIQNKGNNFIVYAPNAFDKKTCDPEWTRFDWPCRGTEDTCQYNNILTTEGHPTNDCCWRYSFRSQLQEAKDTGGFMLQVLETDGTDRKGSPGIEEDAKLGKGQKIELDMANRMGIKVFQVYCPETPALEYEIDWLFEDRHIGVVTKEISRWYNDGNRDMSVTIIRQPK